MKWLFSSLIILAICSPSFAQLPEVVPVNYSEIKKATENPSSAFFYPNLYGRFKSADTTLTVEEFRHLFYGYMFKDDYSPYVDPPQHDRIKEILNKKELSEKDRKELVKLSEEAHLAKPFSLKFLNYRVVAYREAGNKNLFLVWRKMLFGVINAMISSGDGLSPETAIHVGEVNDEYWMIEIFDFTYGGKQSLRNENGRKYDYLTLAENENGVEGLYFDITEMFGTLSKMFKKGEETKGKKKKKK
ncbi:MAG: DUF4919 domain-containing protein [Flavobacteriales bacterium]|nr:DUF4919 domain-containing protein [Flavobacteriales bacterium]